MCPPVSVSQGAKGMPCLYAAWLYQLVHGDQKKICFSCFKAAVLNDRGLLLEGQPSELVSEPDSESGSVLDSVSGSEPDYESGCEPDFESGSEPDSELEAGAGPIPEQSPPSMSMPIQEELGELLFIQAITMPKPVPTELEPKEVVPLELGPQEAEPLDQGPEFTEWAEALPRRFDDLFDCSHQLMPPLSWWDVFNGVNMSPGQPVLLELSAMCPMTHTGAELYLTSLQFFILLTVSQHKSTLLSMSTRWVVMTQAHRWELFLDPGEVRTADLVQSLDGQDLQFWRLIMLECPKSNQVLVPALCGLRKRGFRVHSYLPWQDYIPDDWGLWPPNREKLVEDPRLGPSSPTLILLPDAQN
ncbi:testis-expressed protein 19.2-like [Meriones unguiculatus]|uniref:testis-expressed protein 19.2-like n=1 Tax=Meriones unguiculatus TaxID=10047 RepID=UPI000B4ED13F|nr:testis-expressed protein 19.2-like [Meriones unguiculatus]